MTSDILEPLLKCSSLYFEIVFILFFKRIVFLENPSPKHCGRINLMVIITFILTPFAVFPGGTPGADGYNTGINLLLAFGLLPITIYSTWTGRKKRRILGVLETFPVMAFGDVVSQAVGAPLKAFGLDDNGLIMLTLIFFFMLSFAAILLIVTFKPKWYLTIERDIENRSMTLIEELVVSLIGLWVMLMPNLQVLYPEDAALVTESIFGKWATVYISVTNLVVAFGLLSIIIATNRRKYYFEQNLNLQKSLISTMAELVEDRDENTGGHIQRTAKYVELIAKELKRESKFTDILTDKYIEDMAIAAPLHDVGKISVPDAVLNKAGRLDDTEFQKMQFHTTSGRNILDKVEINTGNIDYLTIAKEMAEYHHERIDGKGYPHGIAGDEIPLCARILAVADVFDALVSRRCYKEPMPLEKAYAIIREESGTHFDCDVVLAFMNARDDIEKALKLYSD